jgi:hypothetical protein
LTWLLHLWECGLRLRRPCEDAKAASWFVANDNP